MTGAELVVRTLAAAQEAGEPASLAQRRESRVAAGEDFPGIALVAHIPDDLVARRLERVQQGDCQLDDAEPRPDVPAGLGHHVDQALAHLVGEGLQLLAREVPQVVGSVDAIEQRHVSSAG